MGDLITRALSGDEAALTVLFWLGLPVVLVVAAISAVVQKLRGK